MVDVKSSRVRALIGLALLVALLLLAWTIFEARRQRRQVEETIAAQAAVLSQSLSPALAAASNASLEIDEMVYWRLLDNARLLSELWSHNLQDPEHLEELAEAGGLDSALFLDSGGRVRLAVGEPIPEQIVGQLSELLSGRAEELILGTSLEDGIEHLGAAAAAPSGEVVLVRVHPSSARTLVQRLGVENLLASMVGSGGVLYLSYQEERRGLVAEAAWDSQGVPPPAQLDSAPFPLRDRTAIEVAMPVETQAGNRATLRIGLDGSALQRVGVATMRRTLLVGLVLFAFAVSASSFAVVSRLRVREREEAAAKLAELQTARRRSERLAAAGALTAGLAHEVRSPLNAIGLAAQRLERKLSATGDSQQIAGRIRNEVSRLEGVLREFLELASPVSDRRESFDLSEEVRQVLELLAEEAHAHNVVLRPSRGSVTLSADHDSIHRAVVNLVRNAIQASPDGGAVEVLVSDEAHRAILKVIDRGTGLDPAIEGREFDPFVTGRATGTGLGLALVKRVAEEHGGSVALYSHDGGGTIAQLSLPKGQGAVG
jgi:signal transduction histidine kinase